VFRLFSCSKVTHDWTLHELVDASDLARPAGFTPGVDHLLVGPDVVHGADVAQILPALHPQGRVG
jgi:hypothetical protein